MPRNFDNCMFCGDNPCTCQELAKPKKTARRPKKASVVTVDLLAPTTTSSVPTADLKAAMKAMEKEEPVPLQTVTSQAIHQAAEVQHDEETEFADLIEVLSPILHHSELKKYSSVRAQRWREKNRDGIS